MVDILSLICCGYINFLVTSDLKSANFTVVSTKEGNGWCLCERDVYMSVEEGEGVCV